MVESERGQPFIDADVINPIADGVRTGRYHLVLGAGASYSCSNAQGTLPLAGELEEILLQAAGEEGAAGVGLPRAYEAALATVGQHGVVDLLRSRLAGATPLPWHLLLPMVPWEAIWSFNVDDVLENAYAAQTDRRQIAKVCLWQDQILPFGGKTDEVPLVHLHGYVGDIGRRSDPQLVFNWQEYLAAVRQGDRASWQTRFRGDYSILPVIVLGAQLSGELDILEVIRSGNRSAMYGLPSVVVRPNISQFERNEYERWGLIAVDATAEDFMRYLLDAVHAVEPEVVGDEYVSRYTERSFHPYMAAPQTKSATGHDFFGGHSPNWEDIRNGLDAVPAWLPRVVSEIGTPESFPNRQLLYVLEGSPFTGKSTALLRLAAELHKRGWQPNLLVGRDRIEWNETLQYFRTRPNAMLMVDGVAAEASDLAELIHRARGLDQRLLVIGSERRRHHVHLQNALPQRHVVGLADNVFIDPTDDFWLKVVETRDRHARLGRLEGVSRKNAQLHFLEHGRDLFSALASLEDSQGFIDRGLKAYADLRGSEKLAFAVVALLAHFDLPAPSPVICTVAGLQISQFMGLLDSELSLGQWMVRSDEVGHVELRHRYLGDLIVGPHASDLHEVPLDQTATEICKSLTDRVGPKVIRQKSLAHRVVQALMDRETVERFVGQANVDEWYARLEGDYGWSARYWEQRALGLAHNGVLDRAYSYAQRAVTAHRDAFTCNTLGTVVMRRATDADSTLDDAQRRSAWREALGALTESRTYGRGRFEHPFVTFFSYTLKFIQSGPVTAAWSTTAEQAYLDWRLEASRLDYFDNPQLKSLVEQFPAEWRT